MRIRVVVPVTPYDTAYRTRGFYAAAARPDVEISLVCLDEGPASIECDEDEALAVPGILTAVREAEAQGMDAVIIDCMADPGLSPAREAVSIPVVGPAQAGMSLAAMLAHRFSVIGVLERDICAIERQGRAYGFESRLASVRPVNIPVLAFDRDPSGLEAAVVDQAIRAVREDRAHAILFGCTGMQGLGPQVARALAEDGRPVPVIDPTLAALKLAEGLVDAGLTHSKRSYPPREPKSHWP
ncbi:MAG: aspartate/glutamate racemase family protein [Acidobacteriota bacterium]